MAEVADARLIDAHSFCWMLVRLKLPAAAQSSTIPLPRAVGSILPIPRPPAAGAAMEIAALVAGPGLREIHAKLAPAQSNFFLGDIDERPN